MIVEAYFGIFREILKDNILIRKEEKKECIVFSPQFPGHMTLLMLNAQVLVITN